LEGAEKEISPREALTERDALEKHLVELKLKIDDANRPVKELIFALQEAKGRIGFYTRISTQHGKIVSHRNLYREEAEMTYVADIRKNDLDELIRGSEKEIDGIQEKLDQHNNRTTIDVELLI
jgi:hypothetical protein